MRDERPRTLGSVLLEAYRPAFEHQFRYHPNKEGIVDALMKGDNSVAQIEAWFAEAEMHSWRKMTEACEKMPVIKGQVSFPIYDKVVSDGDVYDDI